MSGAQSHCEAWAKSEAMGQEMIDAATTGDVAKVDALLARGYPVDACNRFGDTAMMWAAGAGDLDMLDFLIAKGGDVDAKSNTGMRAMMEAAVSAEAGCVRRLFEAGAEVDCANQFGETALFWAVRSFEDYIEEVAMGCLAALLATGCDLEGESEFSVSAMLRERKIGSQTACDMLTAERDRRALISH